MYVSIGVDCGTAKILESMGLRHCSLPFDWVVTYEGVTKIIEKNFQNFLPEQISCTNDNKILNKNDGVLFVHNSFPDDADQMNRRIQRFLNMLETKDEKIIFIRKSHGSHHHDEYNNIIDDIEDAKKLNEMLESKYHNLTFEIHVILICDKCFMGRSVDKGIYSNIFIHNISRPYPYNVNCTNPDYFDDLCRKIFANP